MKNTFVIICLLFMFSCMDAETKFVRAEFAKTVGRWKIDKVILPTNAPKELQDFFKSGEILFADGCPYNAKEFARTNQSCGADIDVNGKIFGFSYNYLYDKQQYKWNLSVSENSDAITLNSYFLGSQIFDGNWEVIVDGNTLTAKRKGVEKPYQPQGILYEGEVTFTATRK